MEQLKNLLLMYFFGFLTLASFLGALVFSWWSFVSVALDCTRANWLAMAVVLWVLTVLMSVVYSKFEDRVDEIAAQNRRW